MSAIGSIQQGRVSAQGKPTEGTCATDTEAAVFADSIFCMAHAHSTEADN